jgi:hypothetical protein
MSNEEKTRVDLTNRPSKRHSHTSKEWSDHIEVREASETRQDIVSARKRLGQFTARFVIEAMCSGEKDAPELIRKMLEHVDGDQLIDDMDVDPRALRKLADNVGGKKSAHVVQNSVLREIKDDPQPTPKEASVGDQQVELLRALLKTMDPEVVKRALTGG